MKLSRVWSRRTSAPANTADRKEARQTWLGGNASDPLPPHPAWGCVVVAPGAPRPRHAMADVAALLAATLEPDARTREAAEAALRAVEHQRGYLTTLFQVAAGACPGVPPHVGQAASVYLKNLVRREWPSSGVRGSRARFGDGGEGGGGGGVLGGGDDAGDDDDGGVTAAGLHAEERDAVRDSLVEAMARARPAVRSQLAEALECIVMADFPDRYPQLLPQILANLASDNTQRLTAGLVAARCTTKIFEFRRFHTPLPPDGGGVAPGGGAGGVHDGGDGGSGCGTGGDPSQCNGGRGPTGHDCADAAHRPASAPAVGSGGGGRGAGVVAEPLDQVVEALFPQLLQLLFALERTIRDDDSRGVVSEEPHVLQKIICKCFHSALHVSVPSLLVREPQHFEEWMKAFSGLLMRPVPPAVTAEPGSEGAGAAGAAADADTWRPLDAAARKALPQWKAKQWVLSVGAKLFQRSDDSVVALTGVASRCLNHAMVRSFKAALRNQYLPALTAAALVALRWPALHLSPRVANLALNLLEAGVPHAPTFDVVRPTVQPFLTDVLFPFLCLDAEDLAQWKEEPIEYVRRSHDVMEDYYSPRAAACSLLFTLSKLRPKGSVIPFLAFLANVLEQYQQSPTHEAAVRKDGALLAIGHVKDKLLSRGDLRTSLHTVLLRYTLEDLRSPHPFLRSRACWLFGQVAAANALPPDVLLPSLRGLVCCLSDEHFPVRVQAAVDLRHFLAASSAAEALRPELPRLLEALLRLMDDVDNTDIVASVEQLVAAFPNDVAPLAVPLCSQLVSAFQRAAASASDDDESSFAATQCIQTMESILTSLSQSGIATADEADGAAVVVSTAAAEVAGQPDHDSGPMHDPAARAEKVAAFAAAERVLQPILDRLFDEERIEFFEESLHLLGSLVYFSAEASVADVGATFEGELVSTAPGSAATAPAQLISPYLWSLLPAAVGVLYTWAGDYASSYVSVIDAFLHRGAEALLSRSNVVVIPQESRVPRPQGRPPASPLLHKLLQAVVYLWEPDSDVDDEAGVAASRIASLIILHCGRAEQPGDLVSFERRARSIGMDDPGDAGAPGGPNGPPGNDTGAPESMPVAARGPGGPRGGVSMNHEIAFIVTHAARTLPSMSDPVSLAVLRTLGLCIIHASTVTLAALEQCGCSDAVFGFWVHTIRGRRLRRRHDRKTSALAFCALLDLHVQALPPTMTVRGGYVALVDAVLLLLDGLQEGRDRPVAHLLARGGARLGAGALSGRAPADEDDDDEDYEEADDDDADSVGDAALGGVAGQGLAKVVQQRWASGGSLQPGADGNAQGRAEAVASAGPRDDADGSSDGDSKAGSGNDSAGQRVMGDDSDTDALMFYALDEVDELATFARVMRRMSADNIKLFREGAGEALQYRVHRCMAVSVQQQRDAESYSDRQAAEQLP